MGEYNLALLAEAAFERLGDYEAVNFEGKWVTSGELFARLSRLSSGLVGLGLEPGDRVVVMLPNSPDVPVVYNAVWRAGGAITPVMFLLPPDEVSRIITDSGARAVITSPDFLPVVQVAAAESEVKWIVSTGDEAEGVVSLSSLEAGEPSSVVVRDDSDLCALLYTGGTTGRSKGVMLSHENLAFCAKGAVEANYVPGETSTMVALPLAHGFGVLVTVRGFFLPEPGRSVLMGWFEPQRWLNNIAEFQVQLTAMVPSMLQMLLDQPLEEFDLSSWKRVIVGAAPLSPNLIEEFEGRVPSVSVYEGYGLTESGTAATVNPPGARKVGSVGKPYAGYEIRVVDPDGTQVASGETGEILIRSKGVMAGYWNSEEETKKVLRDGWLHTGDVGYLDEDGYLFIVDRIKDLIIRGGFNVYPRDVEDALVEHPAVSMAGVIGRADPRLGEEIVAFVQLSPGQEAEESALIEFAKKKLGAHKYPRDIKVLGSVPLTPVGKVDRRALRARLEKPQ